MESSICKIIPENKYKGSLKIIHYVYETNNKRFKQPFCSSTYRVYIVTNGVGTLKVNDAEFSIGTGSVFFTFPNRNFEFCGSDNLRYAYIGFTGDEVKRIFSDLAIFESQPVYEEFEGLLDFWITSITKINPANASILAESVLLYTLALVNTRNILTAPTPDENRLYHMLIDFIDNNYTFSDLSLSYISGIFSYSEKYLSHIFSKNNEIGFSAYVQNLRINRAIEFMKHKEISVKAIAGYCGYNDPLYFSKVFKKKTGLSPKEYIKQIQNQ